MRRTSTRVSPDHSLPQTVWHLLQSRTSSSHQGRGPLPAQDGSVETHCWLWTTGCFRDRPQQTTVLPTQPPRPRPLPTTTRWLEGRCPVVSNRKCSKDVTTHQHWLRARPRHPCPVSACSGVEPLPGKRSSPLRNMMMMSFICSFNKNEKIYGLGHHPCLRPCMGGCSFSRHSAVTLPVGTVGVL